MQASSQLSPSSKAALQELVARGRLQDLARQEEQQAMQWHNATLDGQERHSEAAREARLQQVVRAVAAAAQPAKHAALETAFLRANIATRVCFRLP